MAYALDDKTVKQMTPRFFVVAFCFWLASSTGLVPLVANGSPQFKCIDDLGNLTYSDRPCSGGEKLELETNRDYKEQESAKQPDFATLYQQKIESDEYRQVVERYVQAASKADLTAMISLSSSTSISEAGENRVVQYLEQQVIPFFSDFSRLHNVTVISRAIDSSRVPRGYWFYTYIETRSQKVRPFSICVTADENGFGVSDVVVDQCREDRHPFCPE